MKLHLHNWLYCSTKHRICKKCGETQKKEDTTDELGMGGRTYMDWSQLSLEYYRWIHQPFEEWEKERIAQLEADKKDKAWWDNYNQRIKRIELEEKKEAELSREKGLEFLSISTKRKDEVEKP